MRALFVLRPDAHAQPGGDAVHAERAATALRGLGVDVDVVATDAPRAGGYDVAHVFGIFDPPTAERQMSAVRASGTPLVLSPIWWDLTTYFTMAPRLNRALDQRTPARVDAAIAALREREARYRERGREGRGAAKRLRDQSALLRMADVALPASEIEAFLYANVLRVVSVPYVVAPLGIDDDAFASPRAAQRTGVICAGRVEPRKNQAALLYALRDVPVDVTIVGRAYEPAYLALCRRWATPRTTFVDHVPQHELVAMLARAAVHVLPSWVDTPGLASLEAAATGARVVTGARGTEHEYFGAEADYADPLDPATIRAAVVRALERGPRDRGDGLERRLGARTWHAHGERTLEAYARAVARRR